MNKKAFIVTGLGYGDEGKGTLTHWLSCRHGAHTVIRIGGPQALHHVVSKNGTSHVFSQFGSGTLRGAATHLSKHMVIDPHAILKEGEALIYECGIRGVFDMMTIHEDALVITPFQAIAGRLRELLRGKERRGSVGIGVGETVLDADILKEGAIRVKDLRKPFLRKKLESIQCYKWAEFEECADRASVIPPEVQKRVQLELGELKDSDTVEWAIERFTELAKRVHIVNTDYVVKRILGIPGTVVFENSQGVLLDPVQGFHPYTTKVRTTPLAAKNIIRECGYDGDVKSLGILRAYHTRHGAGPFVSESTELTTQLPDSTNKEHPWQGSFRVGYFDMIATRYAIEACGKESIDGLVLTCLDRIWPRGSWKICDAYTMPHTIPNAESVFSIHNNIIVGIKADAEGSGARHLTRQEKIGQVLQGCVPHITTLAISSGNPQECLINLCASTLKEILGIPVVTVSVGETEGDKIEIEKGQ